MRSLLNRLRPFWAVLLGGIVLIVSSASQQQLVAPISFELKKLPFRLESDEGPARNAPETMAGGVAVFDYNGDGRPDIFFANGAPALPAKSPTSSTGIVSTGATAKASLPTPLERLA